MKLKLRKISFIRKSLHQTFWKTRYFTNVLQKKNISDIIILFLSNYGTSSKNV